MNERDMAPRGPMFGLAFDWNALLNRRQESLMERFLIERS